MPKSSTSDGTDDALAEWQAARDLIGSFDERIHDLRKYGFGFITTLLATQSLLIPSLVPGASSGAGSSGEGAIPDAVKLGVLLVTLLLVVALRLGESNYQFFQEAAKDRALILERKLNLELTEVISDRFNAENVSRSIAFIYVLFSAGVFAVGLFVLRNSEHVEFLSAFTLLSVVTIFLIPPLTSLRYEHDNNGEYWKEDWTIDKLGCRIGDIVRITLTNMERSPRDPKNSNRSIQIPAGSVVWEVRTENGDLVYSKSIASNITVNPQNNFVWEWKTEAENEIGLNEGIVEVFPSLTRIDSKMLDRLLMRRKRGDRALWADPLRRKIKVMSSEDSS